MAWTRTDDDLRRVEIDNLLQSDFVVPVDGAAGAFEHKELVDIPGEGVVIVDQDDIRVGDRRARVGRNGHSDGGAVVGGIWKLQSSAGCLSVGGH